MGVCYCVPHGAAGGGSRDEAGELADILRGLQDFLAAYPGLALRFETYVTYPDDPRMEFYAAKGSLSMEFLAKAKADVTS